MIVTADPLGDFNATSQILRYSALAREITVPRIPSVTSTILANSQGVSSRSYFGGRTTPSDTERETMEIAALEIARMSEEIDGLRDEVAAEMTRRMETEAHLLSMEDRILEVEMEIREECWREMETRMQGEMARWKASWEAERERGDEHVDRKLEILTRGIDAERDEGDEDKENFLVEGLEDANQRLRRQVAQLQRELQGRSPSKKSILGESRGFVLERSMENLRMSADSTKSSPVKKVRKLTARKWDLVDEDEML